MIGGFLTTFFSWRWGFGLELVIVIFVLALSHRIKYFPPTMKLSDLDKLSVVLSSFGILIFVLGILSLNTPKNREFSLVMMVVGIILLLIFYLREKKIINRNELPFTDIRLFKDRNFTLGSLTRMIMQLALAGAVFVLPVFLQQVTGSNAFTTGLAILP